MQFVPVAPPGMLPPPHGPPIPDPRRRAASVHYFGVPGPPPPPFPAWHMPVPVPVPVPPVPVPVPPPFVSRAPDGWYVPRHPPGIAIPPAAPPAQIDIPPPPPAQDAWIHAFWKGRFAPFPGSTSSPTLVLAKTPSRGVPIQRPSVIYSTPPSSRHSTISIEEKEKENTSDKKSPSATSSTPENHNETKLDKYADVFIPQYLQDIQKQPHSLRSLPPIPLFPSMDYLQKFFPITLIDVSTAQKSSILTSPPPATAPSMTTSYHQHWNALLSWELHKLAVDKEQIVLWKTGVKVANWDGDEFRLAVPGIRENTPKLDLGDIIILREVLEPRRAGSGIAFEGGVVSARKREGLIHFYCPALKHHIQTYVGPVNSAPQHFNHNVVYTPEDDIPLVFNISFIPTARPTFLMDVASRTVHDAMGHPDDSNRRRTSRRWIFPNPEHLREQTSVGMRQRYLADESWSDAGLNEEQKLAVSSIALHESPTPYLIIGPPGTGKTRTIVEAVIQILRVHPEACILLCAPSNPATDTLVQRLRSSLSPQDMFRLNDPNRTFAEVPLNITQYCFVEDDRYSIPPWETLLRYRVIVCTCLDAGILVDAHCTNNHLAKLESSVVNTLHPRKRDKEPIVPHFTHLLIDEAAQAAEPELLIPIGVVLPGMQPDSGQDIAGGAAIAFGSVRPVVSPQLVLCGDPNQLGPIVAADAARDAELDVSLLQRLYDREVYANYRNKPWSITSMTFRPFTNLVKNYRSHPAILMPPSAIFYDDSLVPCAVNGTIVWEGMLNPNLPLMFLGTESSEECVDERSSWFNSGEINRVADTITSLLNDGWSSVPPLQASEIGVMSPFREQVWKIREKLRKVGLSAVDVGTVEDYQGREMRVCIISCVRSSTRFLKDDLARGLGLVYDRKRMNVAITRAKELLVVVGNPNVLQQDPFWRSFLQFTLRNKLYSGPELKIELDGNYMSRLESELIGGDGVLDEEEHGIAMAGGIAREILRE
ncbi:hypothetical protein MKEN_01141300 [Mycena kentingensis (nom. inval.)]|nr:hypothetical protein MKEN_01141300 [Mycena kentingensis (nom. inval.)]